MEKVESILNENDYGGGDINDYGGGDIDWWFDYIRNEINHCNRHWRSIIENYIQGESEDMTIPEMAKEITELIPRVLELGEEIKVEYEPKTTEAEDNLACLEDFLDVVELAYEKYEPSIREIAGE